MLEFNLVPAMWLVAGITFLTVLPPVIIIATMTRNTFSLQVICLEVSAMTGIAFHLAVLTGQRIIGIPVMIKIDACPAFLAMTVAAFRTVASCMDIVQPVAAVAIRRYILVLLRDMTTVTANFFMFTDERVIGIVMVEFLFGPALHLVAV
jgi:hypothetical protein